jgi:hypothetical protein
VGTCSWLAIVGRSVGDRRGLRGRSRRQNRRRARNECRRARRRTRRCKVGLWQLLWLLVGMMLRRRMAIRSCRRRPASRVGGRVGLSSRRRKDRACRYARRRLLDRKSARPARKRRGCHLALTGRCCRGSHKNQVSVPTIKITNTWCKRCKAKQVQEGEQVQMGGGGIPSCTGSRDYLAEERRRSGASMFLSTGHRNVRKRHQAERTRSE